MWFGPLPKHGAILSRYGFVGVFYSGEFDAIAGLKPFRHFSGLGCISTGNDFSTAGLSTEAGNNGVDIIQMLANMPVFNKPNVSTVLGEGMLSVPLNGGV